MSQSWKWRATVALAFLVNSCDLFAGAPDDKVFEGVGLKRAGSFYILPEEADVQKKVNQAKSMYNQLLALSNQAARSDPEAHREVVRVLNDEIIHLAAELKTVNRELSRIPRGRWGFPINSVVAEQLVGLTAYRDQLDTMLNQKTFSRDTLANRPPDPAIKKKIAEEFKARRDLYLEAVSELGKLIGATEEHYDELAKNSQVARALARVNRATRLKLKLGPSREFVANRSLVKKLEANASSIKPIEP